MGDDGQADLARHGEVLGHAVRHQFRHGRRDRASPMEFQFGTNWAYYSHYVGDVFGVPLAIEG